MASLFQIMTTLIFSLQAQTNNLRPNLPGLGQGEKPGEVRSNDQHFRDYIHQDLVRSGKVALTFDDGPSKYTPQILKLLDQYDIKATFFVVQSMVSNQQRRSLLIEMIRNGHIVASHTKFHQNSNQKTRKEFVQEITENFQFILSLYKEAGVNPYFIFRFPFGAHGRRKDYHHFDALNEDISLPLLGDNCIFYSFWDQDSMDWAVNYSSERFRITQDELIENLMVHLRPGTLTTTAFLNGKLSKTVTQIKEPLDGGVILLHDINPYSVVALEKFLQVNHDQGHLDFVTLAEIAEYQYPEANRCLLNSHHTLN